MKFAEIKDIFKDVGLAMLAIVTVGGTAMLAALFWVVLTVGPISERQAAERVEERVAILRKRLLQDVVEVVSAECERFVSGNGGADDVLWNYRNYVRQTLTRDCNNWALDADIIWGRDVRATILQEHKEAILPLIAADEIKRLTAEVEHLRECLRFERPVR